MCQVFYNGEGSRDGARARESGAEVPTMVQGQSRGRRSGDFVSPEAEAKFEINVQFLTFSCRKFKI